MERQRGAGPRSADETPLPRLRGSGEGDTFDGVAFPRLREVRQPMPRGERRRRKREEREKKEGTRNQRSQTAWESQRTDERRHERSTRGLTMRHGNQSPGTRDLRGRSLPTKNGHAGSTRAQARATREYQSDSSSKRPASSVPCGSPRKKKRRMYERETTAVGT